MDFTIRIANQNILVHSVYENVFKTCKSYLVDNAIKPDIEIRIDESMISDEGERNSETNCSLGPKTIEVMLVHRLIAEALLDKNTFLIHGAVIAIHDRSFMFTGRSGTGKTTHIEKWLDNSEDAFVVNGDKPMIILNENGAFACGTPWCGKEGYETNVIVPLRSIVFMERSYKNYMEALPFKQAFPLLLDQTYQPAETERIKKTIKLLFELKDHVSFFRFYFDNYKKDSFQVSFDALTKQGV